MLRVIQCAQFRGYFDDGNPPVGKVEPGLFGQYWYAHFDCACAELTMLHKNQNQLRMLIQ